MTTKQLHRLVALWQKRLRIQDWDLTVTVHSEAEMAREGYENVWGICFVEIHKKRASIKISNAVGSDGSKDTFESVLVHELLHVMIPGRDLGVDVAEHESAPHIAYERIIDQLSHILVEAYRGKN